MTSHDPTPEFERLLEYLRQTRSFDFTGYKRSTLMRRTLKRMQTLGLEEFDAYQDYLEVHPDEFELLFNTVLINVTEFFRDPEAWRALAEEHIPAILSRKRRGEAIRVWTAGCASGEEAYSLVMLLAEALGVQEFKERVKVYATDLDEEALLHARQASYPAKELVHVPEALREKYFQLVAGQYVFRPDLRRLVIFGRHNLVEDAPISQLDLLTCRNTLMYFNGEVQGRIMARFHFAIRPGGLLMLGRAEMMRSYSHLFRPVDLKARVFEAVPQPSQREKLRLLGSDSRPTESTRQTDERQLRIRDAALNAEPAAQLVVDTSGTVLLANHRARRHFGLSETDIGRPLQDLRVSYAPVELRSPIERAYAERRPVLLPGIDMKLPDGTEGTFDIQISPLLDDEESFLGVSVAFSDVTRYRRLQASLQEINQELEAAYEELQSTNEELETTNEELQSTIEELETTNEELQSTNEELETMNEELQSTNEELETMNAELRVRTQELDHVNGYLRSILASLSVAVVVLDRELRVRIWSHRAEDLWGMRLDEVEGKNLMNLDLGLPVEKLNPGVRACLRGKNGMERFTVDGINRRGRPIEVRVTCTPLQSLDGEPRGVVLLLDDRPKEPADATA